MIYLASFHGYFYSLARAVLMQELPCFIVIIMASGKMDERDLTALLQYGSSQSHTAAHDADTLHKISVKIQRPDGSQNSTSSSLYVNKYTECKMMK